MRFFCELHPVYGAIHRDGEPVHEGELIGLSADGTQAVAAPYSGIVRISRSDDGGNGRLHAEILPSNEAEKRAGAEPTH